MYRLFDIYLAATNVRVGRVLATTAVNAVFQHIAESPLEQLSRGMFYAQSI